jgi:diguanylate cyclase (GGDEF)-like protein
VAGTLGGERAPRVLLDLLDTGLRDLLVQTVVREGDDSDAWAQLTSRLGELHSALQAAGDGRGDPARARAVQPAVRELDEAIRAAQPGNVAHSSALRQILDIAGGREPLETTPAPTPPAEEAIPEQRLDDLPRLRRWLKRVEDLRPGTVMSYRGADGERRRMRLVWISQDGERYAFVNDQGKKVAELSRLQLARKLSQGLKPPAPVDEMSLLHRSVFDALAGAREELGAARERDAVTALPGDSRLLRELERTVRHAQQHEARHAFLCLAIDAFHLVDELYDAVDGDRILAEFAQRLARLHERRSLTGRLGEDEFGILLLYRDREEALALAASLCEDFAREPLEIAGEAITFTVSIGVSPIDAATESSASALEAARGALEEAREAGGNRALAAAPARGEDGAAGRDRAARQAAVQEAIDGDRLLLRAQPIVRRTIDDDQPTSRHYEVLLAVRGEDGEPTGPGPFIAEAERAGAMGLVDRWVIRQVCAWISTLMDRQRQVPEVAVNLSGQSLRDDDFTDYVLAQLSEYGVGTSKLCFEFTEAGAAENLTKAADFVRTLGNVGCKFSLDDYGSNPADHDYLRQLPVDYVKIDGSLVRRVHESEADRALVRAINDLAHFLGQETIAECVETPEAVEPLQLIGIDLLQGWGVGMPRSLDEVARELRPLET